MIVLKTRVKQALSKTGLPDLDYALNPYAGCSHACIYCYAREYTRYREVSENWGEVIVVKENLLEVLDKETRRLPRGVVGVSTITDPYQPVEALYGLTRRSIEMLLERGFHVSIQTKSTLVLRDLDVLLRHKNLVDVGFTIITMNNEVAKMVEPGSPPPTARADAIRKIAGKGIETWVFMGPIIPGLTDDVDNIEKIILLARETSSYLYYDKLRIKSFMYKRKDLIHSIMLKTRNYNWEKIYRIIESLCSDYGVKCRPGFEYPPENTRGTTLDKYMDA